MNGLVLRLREDAIESLARDLRDCASDLLQDLREVGIDMQRYVQLVDFLTRWLHA